MLLDLMRLFLPCQWFHDCTTQYHALSGSVFPSSKFLQRRLNHFSGQAYILYQPMDLLPFRLYDHRIIGSQELTNAQLYFPEPKVMYLTCVKKPRGTTFRFYITNCSQQELGIFTCQNWYLVILSTHFNQVIDKLFPHWGISCYCDIKVTCFLFATSIAMSGEGYMLCYLLWQCMSDLNRSSSAANKRPAACLQTSQWESDWSVPVIAVPCHTC